MSGATWRGRALGAALALLVQALFLSMVMLSPSRPRINLPHEAFFLLRPLAKPAPTTIDARSIASPRPRKVAPVIVVPTLPLATTPSLAPPSGLAGFGQTLFGCAPEHYADLTPDERARCPKPGEGLAKNDDKDPLSEPKSHAKYEARWQEQWSEDHWVPAPCLPGSESVAQCLIDQAQAENRRTQAAWNKIAADEAAATRTKPPPIPPIGRGPGAAH
jgi:hypothetical protein